MSTCGYDTAARCTSALRRLLTNSAATCVGCRHVGPARRVLWTTGEQMAGGARSLRHQLAGICSTDQTAKTTHTMQHTAHCQVQGQHTMLLSLQKTKLVAGLIQRQCIQLPTERLSYASSCRLVSNEMSHLQALSAQWLSPVPVYPKHFREVTVLFQSRMNRTPQSSRWCQMVADQNYNNRQTQKLL